jgi:hypothetical protein
VPRPQRNASRWRRGFRAMARREEGEYSTYSTDEQRRQRAKDQARWLQNAAVEALGWEWLLSNSCPRDVTEGHGVGEIPWHHRISRRRIKPGRKSPTDLVAVTSLGPRRCSTTNWRKPHENETVL